MLDLPTGECGTPMSGKRMETSENTHMEMGFDRNGICYLSAKDVI